MNAFITIDLEQDCPPFLATYRGMEQGLARIVEILDRYDVKATFFTTGAVARSFPRQIEALVAAGHELGCHGDTHVSLRSVSESEAEAEILRATDTLRRIAPVTSFRAPYLQLPTDRLGLLTACAYTVDSSIARYKPWQRPGTERGLRRLAASWTSSVLRLPSPLPAALVGASAEPVVLFVHPWEFVDLSRERIRWDCRAGTGPAAARGLDAAIAVLVSRGSRFRLVRDVSERSQGAGGALMTRAEDSAR